jgi:putative serine protease PepD
MLLTHVHLARLERTVRHASEGAAAIVSSPVTILDRMPSDEEPDDAFGFQPPLPPDDRLWRHPSELGPGGTGQSVTIVNRPKVAAPAWVIGTAAALLGSAATLGILLGVGAFDDDRTPAPTEVVPIRVPTETGADELAWAEPVLPAVVRVDAQTASGIRSGTGVVYRSDGHLLTTADAVEGASVITVTFADGQTDTVDAQWTDSANDIAVLHVPRVDMPTATIGTATSLELGERSIVISSVANRPSAPTVGVGLISGLSQRVGGGGEVLHDMVQTNVRLAQDATGSPLVDSSGTVVGIMTQRGTETDGEKTPNEGSGAELEVRYATTIDWAKRVADDLVETGHVRQGWLGVRGANLTEDEVSDLGRGGAKLVSVAEGSPAASAGLQEGDIVLAIDARFVTSSSDLVVALRTHEPGDAIAISYRRGGEQGSTLAMLAEKTGTP